MMESSCRISETEQRVIDRLITPPLSTRSSLLMRELTHRINNEFSSLISMTSLAAARSRHPEVKKALADVEDRLERYARVHRVLQMPQQRGRIDATAYLRQLCLAISQSKLVDKNIKLTLADRPLLLSSEQCWLLGLIVNELITNAMRHAFDETGGEVRVEFVPDEFEVECRISDNGSAQRGIRPGNGLRIVEELARALGGTIIQRFGSRGSISVLTFPYDDCA
jgi:two-component sensor histidine kinase